MPIRYCKLFCREKRKKVDANKIQKMGKQMMNKEIIVDGVDVSEWTDEEVRYKFEKHSSKAIRQIAFDLYKQLARKEQECEKLYIQLKADEEYRKEEENTLRKIIKNKEERNIELYKENDKLKQTLTEIKEIAGEQIPYLNIDKANYDRIKDRLKYKQALDEIEKYLDAQQKYFDGEDYHNLLDIINKAKEEINEES